jgi:hypothetical protein
MVKSTVTLTTACSQSLDALGRRLRNARLRRLLSAEAVAISVIDFFEVVDIQVE